MRGTTWKGNKEKGERKGRKRQEGEERQEEERELGRKRDTH